MRYELAVIEKPMKKILVTGSNGFIGSKLVSHFVERKDCMVSLFGRSQADILNTEELEIAFRAHKPDTVIHLAAQTRLRYSLEHVQEDAMTNIIGSINVFDAAVKSGCRNIIYTSTGGARYGETPYEGKMIEHYRTFPVSPYGISKRVAEEYLEYYETKYNIKAIALCLGNVYGPGDNINNGRLIPKILDSIKNEVPFKVYGDGSSLRDYVYIDDVVELLERLAMDGFRTDRRLIYNISGFDYTVQTILDYISDITGKEIDVEYIDNIKGEVRDVSLDCSAAMNWLKWNPKVGIKEGLKRTVKSYGI